MSTTEQQDRGAAIETATANSPTRLVIGISAGCSSLYKNICHPTRYRLGTARDPRVWQGILLL